MARKFANWHDAFMEYYKNVNTAKVFLEWSAYSAVSAALERKTWINVPGGVCYPNQFIFIIAPSGVARKSVGTKPAYRLVGELPNMGLLSTQFSAASLINQLSEIGLNKKFSWEGTEYNHSAAFLYTSEASVSLKDIEGSNIELLTDLWDGGSYPGWSRTISWSRGTVGRGNIRIFNPCLNILGCSTPDWLIKALGGRHALDGGFTSRCLFISHSGGADQGTEWVDDFEAKEGYSHELLDLIHDLKEINKMQGPFRPNAAFRAEFNAMNKEISQWLADNPTATMRGYYSRKLWHVLKLSQVMAAIEGDSMDINANHFKRARNALESIEPSMLNAFGREGNNPDAKAIWAIWDYLRKRKNLTFTKADLMHGFINDCTEKQIMMTIRILTETKKVSAVVQPGMIYYKINDRTPLHINASSESP
jgi:hypothetical protein